MIYLNPTLLTNSKIAKKAEDVILTIPSIIWFAHCHPAICKKIFGKEWIPFRLNSYELRHFSHNYEITLNNTLAPSITLQFGKKLEAREFIDIFIQSIDKARLIEFKMLNSTTLNETTDSFYKKISLANYLKVSASFIAQ